MGQEDNLGAYMH